jgi:hypothetical protein
MRIQIRIHIKSQLLMKLTSHLHILKQSALLSILFMPISLTFGCVFCFLRQSGSGSRRQSNADLMMLRIQNNDKQAESAVRYLSLRTYTGSL